MRVYGLCLQVGMAVCDASRRHCSAVLELQTEGFLDAYDLRRRSVVLVARG
jgi:hypothetical protein